MTSAAARTRRLLAGLSVASVGLLAAACGSGARPAAASAPPRPAVTGAATPAGSPSASPSASAPAPPSASSSVSPGGPSPCPAASLGLGVGSPNGAAGSSYYPIVLTNISAVSCTLYGYPGVSLVTAPGGSQIGATATENPAQPRRLVTLAPGATASALLQVVNAQNYPAAECKPVTAHWLQVYPPGQFKALSHSFSTLTCSATGKNVHVLGVETVQPGSSGQ